MIRLSKVSKLRCVAVVYQYGVCSAAIWYVLWSIIVRYWIPARKIGGWSQFEPEQELMIDRDSKHRPNKSLHIIVVVRRSRGRLRSSKRRDQCQDNGAYGDKIAHIASLRQSGGLDLHLGKLCA